MNLQIQEQMLQGCSALGFASCISRSPLLFYNVNTLERLQRQLRGIITLKLAETPRYSPFILTKPVVFIMAIMVKKQCVVNFE